MPANSGFIATYLSTEVLMPWINLIASFGLQCEKCFSGKRWACDNAWETVPKALRHMTVYFSRYYDLSCGPAVPSPFRGGPPAFWDPTGQHPAARPARL